MTPVLSCRSLRRFALFLAFGLEWSCGGDRGLSDMTGPSAATPPPAAAATPASKPKLRFAVIPRNADPVFNYTKLGADRAGATLGQVEVLWRAPEGADPAGQKQLLEALITQKVDGIAIACADPDLLTETIDKAVDGGIPVVTFESDAPKSKRRAFYGTDDLAAGKVMGEEAAKLLGGKGTVAILTSLEPLALQRRVLGVQEALKAHAEVKIVEIYDLKEDAARSAPILEAGSKKHADLGAWISVGGWLASTEKALDAVDSKRTQVVSFGTLPPAIEGMKAGKVQVLVGPKYFGWGSEAVKILADLKAGKPPAQPVIDSGVDIVTPASLAQFEESFAKLEKP
jgi:ribose transport system substrate-binding protein